MGLKGDLTDYRKALQRYVEESGKDTLEVAASLAFLEAGKKGLKYESMPNISSGKTKRREREPLAKGDQRESKKDRKADKRSNRDENLQSYRLEVGEYHGVQKGDIVGAIANEVGLDPKHMGKIRMFKDHSYIDLPKDMPNEIFETLKSVWVQGHQMNISIDKGRSRHGGKAGKFKKNFGKSGKRFNKSGDFKKKSKSRFQN